VEAIWLDGYALSTVWAEEVRPEIISTRRLRPWNAWNEMQVPLAVSYLGYFGLAFFATRWWKLAVRTRPRRFSFAAVLGAGFWGFVLLALLPGLAFPDPAFVALVSAAVIVQL